MIIPRHPACLLVLCASIACGDAPAGTAPGDPTLADAGGAAASADAGPCDPPDVLVVLDRTMSMAMRPDGAAPPASAAGLAASKWAIAIAAIEALVAELDGSLRFGLVLFPRDPGDGSCRTIDRILVDDEASNPRCQVGEAVVLPGDPDPASAIDAALDVEATRLCRSTPIAGGLVAARDALAARRRPGRPEHVLLVGDGRDTCDEAAALAAAQALARDGVRVHPIGFDATGGHLDPAMLNDLACAGRTAPGFPAPCVADAAGDYRAVEREGPTLYRVSADAAALAAALGAIAGDLCCGCDVE